MLLQIIVCVVPAMALLAVARPEHAARWLFLTVIVLGSLTMLFKGPEYALALVVGSLPGTMLLREFFLYNSIILLLAIPSAACFLLRRPQALGLLRTPFPAMVAFTLVYWGATYYVTGEYYLNLRGLELAFAVGALLVLVQTRELLATALLGMVVAVIATGAAMTGKGDRLGMALIGNEVIGNPISYGLPVAFLLLLTVSDRGKWLMLQRRSSWRVSLTAGLGILLLLSTSRAAWLVAFAGVLALLVLGRYQRFGVGLSLTALVVAATILIQTERGASVTAWSERTFSSDRSIAQRTSGRTDQWLIFPKVAAEALPFGFGPGSGPDTYARYSADDPRVGLRRGRPTAWHSLYQHLTVEIGLIGIVSLVLLFAYVIRASLRWWMTRQEVLPLIGITSFMLIAATVSGFDAFSGLFLGLAMFPSLMGYPATRSGQGGKA
jgi:hypothetical protein